MTTGTFLSFDAFVGSAPGMTGRPPGALETLLTDLTVAERDFDRRPPSKRQLVELRRRVEKALQSTDRDGGQGRDGVSIQPDSFRIGSPDGPKRPDRPLKRYVDSWLAADGWTAGKRGAGSVAIAEDDSKQVRDFVNNRWREEIAVRRWDGRWLHREWRVEADGSGGTQLRMYWWRIAGKGPDVPPEPAVEEG